MRADGNISTARNGKFRSVAERGGDASAGKPESVQNEHVDGAIVQLNGWREAVREAAGSRFTRLYFFFSRLFSFIILRSNETNWRASRRLSPVEFHQRESTARRSSTVISLEENLSMKRLRSPVPSLPLLSTLLRRMMDTCMIVQS